MRLKKDLILLGIMAIVAACAAAVTAFCGGGAQEKDAKLQLTASFYPMYTILLNLTQGIEDVETGCMTQNQTGCLHDYQMTTQDMKTLEHTDAFIINGGGMESFLEDVAGNYPSLTVINAGKELEEDVHAHDDEDAAQESDHEHGEEENAHFWLNPDDYIIQIRTMADGLSSFDGEHAEQYQANAEEYIKKVEALAAQLKALHAPDAGVIVFHDAFVYLAEYLGLEVVRAVEIDSETALSAGEVAEIIEEIKEGHASLLFTEAQYSTEAADTIAKETGAASYIIDSLVTGEEDADAYLRGMEENIAVLKDAFSSE